MSDIVHFTDARESFAYRGKIPAVGTLHDDYFAQHSWNPLHYRKFYLDWFKRWVYYSIVTLLERRGLRQLKALMANSDAATIVDRYKIPKEKITTIYLGVDAAIQPVDEELESRRLADPVLLFVGGNMQRKGLITVFKALQLLTPEFHTLQLQVLGRNQNLTRLKNLSARMGLEDFVHFQGWVAPEKVAQFFQNAAAFVMPSHMEGFGLVYLEAMAAGVPVLGGNVGGTRELIQDGVNGYLVAPDNPIELTEKIRELLQDRELRHRFETNGFATVEKFSPEDTIRETIKFYQSILNL